MWLVLVMILGASLLVVLVPEDGSVSVNEGETEGDAEEEVVEEDTCLVGTEKVLNASAENGYDCVPLDPHSMFHTHPAPVLSVSNVIDDGSTIAILGDVDHLHPDEITVRLSLDEDVTIATQPNTDGAWSLTVQSSAQQIYLNITATHDEEETTSNTTFIEINRTTSEGETNQTDDGSDDGTDDTTGNETNSGTDDGTQNNTGNQTGNNTGKQHGKPNGQRHR